MCDSHPLYGLLGDGRALVVMVLLVRLVPVVLLALVLLHLLLLLTPEAGTKVKITHSNSTRKTVSARLTYYILASHKRTSAARHTRRNMVDSDQTSTASTK